MPPAGDPDAGTAVAAVRLALLAVGMGSPGGQALDVDTLRERVVARRACRDDVVGVALPGLIRDLHTAVNAGRDGRELAELVVSLHVSGTLQWLRDAGASADLRWQAAVLAREAAERLDNPLPRGVAAFGVATVLLGAGSFDLAQEHVGQVAPQVSTGTVAGQRVAGMLAMTSALLAVTQGRPGDADAPLDMAAELAERTGEECDDHAYWALSFGPANVTIWRAATALEAGDHARAVAISERLRPAAIPSPKRRAAFLLDYGRALAPMRGRREDAVRALRKAELISPLRVRRSPFVRDTLAELLARARHDAVGRELRGMAYRAGLPV